MALHTQKANCIVILFEQETKLWGAGEGGKMNKMFKKKQTNNDNNNNKKKKQLLKFLWPASCSSSSILKGFGIILLAPCEVFMCRWCNLLMFVAFLYLYNS